MSPREVSGTVILLARGHYVETSVTSDGLWFRYFTIVLYSLMTVSSKLDPHGASKENSNLTLLNG